MKIEYYCTCGLKMRPVSRWERVVAGKAAWMERITVEFGPCRRCLARAVKEAKGR